MALVHPVARSEQLTDLGSGEGVLVEVGDEVAAVLVLAQLAAFLYRRDLHDNVDDAAIVVFTLHTLAGTLDGGPLASGYEQQCQENTES